MSRILSNLLTLAMPLGLIAIQYAVAERDRLRDERFGAYLGRLSADAPACARARDAEGCVCGDFQNRSDAQVYYEEIGHDAGVRFGLVFEGEVCPHLADFGRRIELPPEQPAPAPTAEAAPG